MTLNTDYSSFSPQKYARIGGVIYLIIIMAGLFGEMFVRNKLVMSGDPAATAHNIMSSEFLWRAGIGIDLLMQLCDLPLIMIWYVLLKPVNKNLALLNLLLNVIQTAVLVANKFNLLAALFFLADSEYLMVFSTQQLHTLSYLAIKLHGYGFGVGLIFFGVVCLLEGYLIFKSGYFPKTIGVLLQIAGVCYLINSISMLLFPSLSESLFPAILVPPFFAELTLALWLLVKGVDLSKWEAATLK